MDRGERGEAPRTEGISLVIGIDPGVPRPRAAASYAVLTLDPAGTIGLYQKSKTTTKTVLAAYLRDDALLVDPRLRLAALNAPVTPLRLDKKPWRARLVEIRFARGAFSGSARGPQPPWISGTRSGWPRYLEGAKLLDHLRKRGLPLVEMPPEGSAEGSEKGSEATEPRELPPRCCAEVNPKAMLAVLLPKAPLEDRPIASEFMGQLDDWLFPQVFLPKEGDDSGRVPFEEILEARAPGLRLAPETLQEAQRIAGLRRPQSRREPLRAFLSALQGILALAGAACLVGAEGETEGSFLLPATWHPDWEEEWADPKRHDPRVRRVAVRVGSSPS